MRKWHRWLSLFFGVFLLWIAATGVASQIVPIVLRGGFEDHAGEQRAQRAAPAVPPGFVCPDTMICRPRPKGGSVIGLLHHLHSGESFGPVGVLVSILSGLALVFFSVSGIWLYVQMWRSRRDRKLAPRWFWK